MKKVLFLFYIILANIDLYSQINNNHIEAYCFWAGNSSVNGTYTLNTNATNDPCDDSYFNAYNYQIVYIGSQWIISDGIDVLYENLSSCGTLPRSGWQIVNGTYPAPYFSFKTIANESYDPDIFCAQAYHQKITAFGASLLSTNGVYDFSGNCSSPFFSNANIFISYNNWSLRWEIESNPISGPQILFVNYGTSFEFPFTGWQLGPDGSGTTPTFSATCEGFNIKELLGSGDINCTSNNEGIVTLIPSGAPRPYSYNWSVNDGVNDSINVNLPGGVSSVTVTAANGCYIHLNPELPMADVPIISNVNIVQSSDCNQNYGSVSLDVNALGFFNGASCSLNTLSCPKYIFYLVDPLTNDTTYITYISAGSLGGSVTTTFTISPGSYNILVSHLLDDNLSCPGFVNVVINPAPTISITVNDVTICKGNTATLSATGADNFIWSTNETSTSITISPSITTIYTVTGSTYGCSSSTKTVSVNVFEPPTLTTTASSNQVCAGTSLTLTANGADTYTWSPGNLITQNIAVSPTISSIYTVDATNQYGCTNTQTLSLTVNAAPTISVNSGAICAGQSFTMTPSGANTYTYSSGTAVVSPTTNVSYNVTGTSALGCVSSNTAVSSVTVNATPTISVNSGAICSGQSFTMTPSGANTYTYSSGTAVVSPTTNVSYNVTGTSALGCVSSNTAVSSVTVNAAPTISVNSGAICAGQSFTMTPSGATTYTYSNGSDVVTSSVNSSYTVTGTDANGCENAAVSSVVVNSLPIISVNSGTICAGQSFTMVPTGAATYAYSNGSDVVTSSVNSSYTVTGTDANGCENTAVSALSVNALPIISVNSGTICAGQSFTMVPTGAATYAYSNGSDVVTSSVNASYTVTGTDANGCENTAVSALSVNALPIISVNSGTICAGQSFTMVPTGAATYAYSNGSDVVTSSVNASYTVTGTDANGCENTAVSALSVNSLPIISVNSGTICAGQSFTMTPSGAATYAYSNGSDVVTSSVNASYTVTGTDANGCENTAVSALSVNALPVVTAVTNNTLLCVGQTATLSVSGATTYTWSTTDNTAAVAVSPTVQTTYTVNGTDANGCSNTTTVTQDVSLCTGIVTLTNSNSSINLYPNPNNGLFTIELTSTSKVIVTNALGQIVIAETFEAGKHSLDIHNEATGVYFVKVIENNNQHIIKVVKQ